MARILYLAIVLCLFSCLALSSQHESSNYKKIRGMLYELEAENIHTKQLAALFSLGDKHINELIQALSAPESSIRLRSQIIIRYLNNKEGLKALEDKYKQSGYAHIVAGPKLVSEDEIIRFRGSEKDLAEIVLREAFFLTREEKQKTSVRLLASSYNKDKVLIELYVNQGVLAEKWYHLVVQKKGQDWEFLSIYLPAQS